MLLTTALLTTLQRKSVNCSACRVYLTAAYSTNYLLKSESGARSSCVYRVGGEVVFVCLLATEPPVAHLLHSLTCCDTEASLAKQSPPLKYIKIYKLIN